MFKIISSVLVFFITTDLFFTTAKSASSGFYNSIQVGNSNLDTPSIANQTKQSPLKDNEQDSSTWGVKVGYQKALENKSLIGIELDYNQDGYSTITYVSGNEYEFRSFNAGLALAYQNYLTEGIYFGIKLGVSYLEQTYKIHSITRDSGFDPITTQGDVRGAIGFEIGKQITSTTSIYLGYKYIVADDLGTTDEAFVATSEKVGANRSVYSSTANVSTFVMGLKRRF